MLERFCIVASFQQSRMCWKGVSFPQLPMTAWQTLQSTALHLCLPRTAWQTLQSAALSPLPTCAHCKALTRKGFLLHPLLSKINGRTMSTECGHRFVIKVIQDKLLPWKIKINKLNNNN